MNITKRSANSFHLVLLFKSNFHVDFSVSFGSGFIQLFYKYRNFFIGTDSLSAGLD
ncbi:hypothetical protein HNR48_001578 [Pseudoteredinibacter isoporae]|uniref:Uncharacterized protein n=1 Tax=Pseudoteredinibacter isoporae TaxID=570281 RepID=A0A7X0JS64_9GAMM|nr:hypothetical protein [Pseudoteredinibacter isoporae]